MWLEARYKVPRYPFRIDPRSVLTRIVPCLQQEHGRRCRLLRRGGTCDWGRGALAKDSGLGVFEGR